VIEIEEAERREVVAGLSEGVEHALAGGRRWPISDPGRVLEEDGGPPVEGGVFPSTVAAGRRFERAVLDDR
jgi:hypothetical protein